VKNSGEESYLKMGQEDYLLREIEKIAIMLRFILGKLTGNKENPAITIEKQFEDTNELLFNEINFDLDTFLSLNESDSREYISHFKGNSPENLELLAEIIFQFGLNKNRGGQSAYFQKALQLYEFCNLTDKTYSLDREARINKIKLFYNECK
jgi:hypothetical protein